MATFRDSYAHYDDAIAWQRQQGVTAEQEELLKELEELVRKARRYLAENGAARAEVAAKLGIPFQEKLNGLR